MSHYHAPDPTIAAGTSRAGHEPRPIFACGQDINPDTGPTAALIFATAYRGHTYVPGAFHCYPDAKGIPFSDTENKKPVSPLVAQFLVYGAWIMPRDGDNPPGRLKIEKGRFAWKNDAAGAYEFVQGPGATLDFVDPVDGSMLGQSDASKLGLIDTEFRRESRSSAETRC